VRSTVAKQFFDCSFSVVLKEIRSKSLLEHLHKPCLNGRNFICPSQIVSELLNGALVTSFSDKGITPHFVRQICFFSCNDRCYLVYEFCGYRLRNGKYRSITLFQIPKILKTALTEEVVMELLFAILHSLWLAQKQFGLVHYDLKPDNIFVQPITSVSQFNGSDLSKIDYFGYCLSDPDGHNYCYYIKNRGYLLKIGDYGTAVSTRVPRQDGQTAAVMPSAVWNNSERLKTSFGIQREFQQGYDVHFFLPQLVKLCECWQVPPPTGLLLLLQNNDCFVDESSSRPRQPILEKTPYDLINDTDWTPYLTNPSEVPNAKSVLIGSDLWQTAI
jgi:serine/threonine protein kinase